LTVELTRNLPRAGERADPGADVDRQAADAVTGKFDLASVAAGADAQTELANRCAQGLGAADGPRRPVEGRQQAIPGRVDVSAPVPFDLPAGQVVVAGKQIGPAGVAEFGQLLGRADDVGEQDGGQDAVQAWPVPLAGQERLHLLDDSVHIAHVRRVIASGELPRLHR
jgi:hypothetical protein